MISTTGVILNSSTVRIPTHNNSSRSTNKEPLSNSKNKTLSNGTNQTLSNSKSQTTNDLWFIPQSNPTRTQHNNASISTQSQNNNVSIRTQSNSSNVIQPKNPRQSSSRPRSRSSLPINITHEESKAPIQNKPSTTPFINTTGVIIKTHQSHTKEIQRSKTITRTITVKNANKEESHNITFKAERTAGSVLINSIANQINAPGRITVKVGTQTLNHKSTYNPGAFHKKRIVIEHN